MQKQELNIKQNVMEQITENKIKMKPKGYFILGSVLTFLGLIASVISSVFLISLLSFFLRSHGPMKDYRLFLMLNSFPWWIIILAIVGLALGIRFALKYDFSYKTRLSYLILGFIASLIIAGVIIDISGLDNLWLKRGPMNNVMRQYLQINSLSSPLGNTTNTLPRRGLNRNLNLK